MDSSHKAVLRVNRTYVIRYTLLFLAMSVLVFSPFIAGRTSLVKKIDGMSQYIVYLRYMGQYLRDALKQILHGNFSLPSYDFSIGMGDDIGQIVRFHPFDFLSVFVPSKYTEILYEVILLLRFYTAGLTFSVFAFSRKGTTSAVNVLSGSVVYVFCGFMLIRVVNHPIYAAPFIVLPLLLLGAEKAMHRKGYCLFIFSVFLGFWSNYYFMYIMSAALLIYVLVRFFEIYRENRVRSFFSLLWRMTAAYLLGLAMSMMTLWPMIQRYLASARLPQSAETLELLLYDDKRRYIAWFLNLISPYLSSGNGTDLNYAVIVLPCLAALFGLSWKMYGTLKKMILACLVVLLVPGAGYVLAFFNRENSRWVFLLAMCCAMAVVFTADMFAGLTRRQLILICVLSGMFLAGVLVQTLFSGINPYNAAAAAELVICLVVLLSPLVRKRGVKTVRRCILLITCLSTLVSSFMTYAPGFGALTKQYVKAGRTLSAYENYFRSRGASLIEDETFYRVEGYNVKHGRENSSIFSDYNSTSEYNSILNAHLMDAMMSQNNLCMDAITTLRGMDARPASMNLAHVRYFITKDSDGGCVPYGFTGEPVYEGKGVRVYECMMPLSFGFSSRTFITRENYDALDALEKEMVQLEAVVVEDSGKGENDPAAVLRQAGLQEIDSPQCQIESSQISLPSSGKDLSCADGTIHAGRKGTLTFSWEERAGYDAYLLLQGLDTKAQEANLRLRTKGHRTNINIRSSEQLYNTGREDYLVHLGSSESDGEQSAVLTFLKAGEYSLDSASVLYVPTDGYEEKIEKLNSQALEDEVIEDGFVGGTVHFDSPGILVLSLPEARGWTLMVDGEKIRQGGDAQKGILPLKADVLYQGILLPEGSHTITLSYATPGGKTGCLAAIAAILVFLVLFYLERRSGRRKNDA